MTDHFDATAGNTTSGNSAVGGNAVGTTRTDHPNAIRVATVVWGFILLGIAALFFSLAQVDLTRFNAGVIAAWVVIGIGGLAIIGGIIGALVRRQ